SDPKHRLLLAREDGGPDDRGVPQGSDPGKSAPEFPITGKNQECSREKNIFLSVIRSRDRLPTLRRLSLPACLRGGGRPRAPGAWTQHVLPHPLPHRGSHGTA